MNFLCDNEHVRAVSFVGGNAAGRHIYQRAGAKLYMICYTQGIHA